MILNPKNVQWSQSVGKQPSGGARSAPHTPHHIPAHTPKTSHFVVIVLFMVWDRPSASQMGSAAPTDLELQTMAGL